MRKGFSIENCWIEVAPIPLIPERQLFAVYRRWPLPISGEARGLGSAVIGKLRIGAEIGPMTRLQPIISQAGAVHQRHKARIAAHGGRRRHEEYACEGLIALRGDY